MKFSENWLRERVNPGIDSEALAYQLTMAGHEVDNVEQQGADLERVIVAEVLAVAKHPDADRLSVCQVADGSGETVEVVCGAPNVVAGMKSPFAGPGVRLPNGMKLRKSKIRGVVSNGMLCSAVELGLGDESDGIIELPADATVGQSLPEFLSLPDTIIDVDLTPNRGDCFSVLGIARDIAAMTGASFEEPANPDVAADIEDQQPVELPDPKACPRFAGRVVRGIDPQAKTPIWMVERLRRSGIRSIHPVVDITNYVMMELGQPLHAYDLDRLQGAIIPRFARAGEKVTLLDEREIELTADTVIITDDSGPIGLAGIMGGLSTAVQSATTDVFFEGAFWPQDVMAGRARSYAMHTDASMRFERGVDPAGQARAVNRAVELLTQISGGKSGPVTDVTHKEHLPELANVPLRADRLARVLGATVEASRVTEILTRLGLQPKADDKGWSVISPSFRFDIAIEEDLIEEVARVYGYDHIPVTTAMAETPLATATESRVDSRAVAAALVARDYQEAITYSFIEAADNKVITGEESVLVLANPISSEMSVMRGSLLAGMLRSASENLARQQPRVRLFEIGKSFHGTLDAPQEVNRVGGLILGSVAAEQWSGATTQVDFFDIKADIEALLLMTGAADNFTFVASAHPALQPGQTAKILRGEEEVGVVGKLHPSVAGHFDIRKDVFVFELDVEQVFQASIARASAVSRFPAIRRDIAVLVDEKIPATELILAIESAASAFIQNVVIFDIYRGPGVEAGLKSVALGLILQETSRTLTDEDADSAMEAAVTKLKNEFAAVLRD